MSQGAGVAAALLGSALGGSAVAATRFSLGTMDPLSVVTLRYAIGALCLVPFCLSALRRLRSPADALAVAGLGIWFFALYPILFTVALVHTTAARGALALSAMPLLTLALAISLGRETFSWRKLTGMLIAVGGLAYALAPKLDGAAPGAWKGDLIMLAAAAMQAVYNVLAGPFIQRLGALAFTALALCIGALTLLLLCIAWNGFDFLSDVKTTTWTAIIYLGIFGCGLLWILWSVGLRQASASAVALTVTVNALTASLLGALFLSEPIGPELIVGLVAVALGITVASRAR
ncbi:MAG TPA: DMT family transporter [Burkholderiales bacterium]|nr:DMT family transporter [Burkholderiales bacterium]